MLYWIFDSCVEHTLVRLPGTFSLSEAATVSAGITVAALSFWGGIMNNIANQTLGGVVWGLHCGAYPNLVRAWLPRLQNPNGDGEAPPGGELGEEGAIRVFVAGLLTCCILNGVALVPWCWQEGGSPDNALPVRRARQFLASTVCRFFVVWMPIVQLLTGTPPNPTA